MKSKKELYNFILKEKMKTYIIKNNKETTTKVYLL